MQEILQSEPDPEQRKPLPLNILLGVLVVIAIALSFWFAFKNPAGGSAGGSQPNLSAAMGAAEQAYAKNIQIENIALSRAENFIHQEVTILNADAVNTGSQSVAALVVTVEFFDDLHQVVLRETRSVLGPGALASGQRRTLTVSFDRMPASWNLQQPAVRVTYLQFGTVK